MPGSADCSGEGHCPDHSRDRRVRVLFQPRWKLLCGVQGSAQTGPRQGWVSCFCCGECISNVFQEAAFPEMLEEIAMDCPRSANLAHILRTRKHRLWSFWSIMIHYKILILCTLLMHCPGTWGGLSKVVSLSALHTSHSALCSPRLRSAVLSVVSIDSTV